MAILGGSPLGLININAASQGGYLAFNSTAERNIPVDKYNKGDTRAAGRGNSVFSGARIVRAWPDISEYKSTMAGIPPDLDANKISKDPVKNKESVYAQRRSLHNNDVYDTSIVNIIEKLGGTLGSLKMADFAYLKDLGVYPNNRLMIARRFGSAVGDNIVKTRVKNDKGKVTEAGALATLISWVPETTDFLTISFGEKWEEADASFKEILDAIGGDISKKFANTGGVMEAAGGVVPLPGFTEIFQRKFLEKMGLLENQSAIMIPSGNPNLIKEAKRRTLINYDTAGSGLDCKVMIQMTCEYEQKFISGLDPTIVWMDILGNITRFGTSPSVSYGLSSKFGQTVQSILDNPMGFIIKTVESLKDALTNTLTNLKEELSGLYKELKEKKNQKATESKKSEDSAKEQKEALIELEQKAIDVVEKAKTQAINFISTALRGLAYKYRVRIMGVVATLSGAPSTPWHITIGNPLRPVFCAGDMYTLDVSLVLGPNLAFNDLPSNIKCTFTLQNARAWGLQEIMAKFNSGYLRTVDVAKTFYETGVYYKTSSGEDVSQSAYNVEPIGNFPYEDGIVSDSVNTDASKQNEAAKPGGQQTGGTYSPPPQDGAGKTASTTSISDYFKNNPIIIKKDPGNKDQVIDKGEGNENSQIKTEETINAQGGDGTGVNASTDDIMQGIESSGKSIAEKQANFGELSQLEQSMLLNERGFSPDVTSNIQTTKATGDKLPKSLI